MARRRREKEHGIFRELLGWLVYILIIIGLSYLIITYVGQRTMVSGQSMEPTLSNGDNLIVDKISYRFRDPQRYDIIVFPYKYEEDTYYIKRIIGMPGETIQVIGGYVYINGSCWRAISTGRSLWRADSLRISPSPWEMTSTSCWEITGTTALTAVIPALGCSKGATFWAGLGAHLSI